MKIAILCNGNSEMKTDRVELVSKLRRKKNEVYIGGVQGKTVNPYYGPANAYFLPLDASRNNTNPLVELKSIYNIFRQIKKTKVDSVIIYGVKNHAAMVLGSWMGGAKRIMCVVNGSGNLFRITGMKGEIVRFMSFPMLKLAYSLSDSICFQNKDDEILFRNKHLISHKTNVFLTGGSGVNLKEYPFQKLPEENRFLFLSRITPSKGLNEYIEAASIVKESYPNVMFDIVGPLDSTVEINTDNLLQQSIDKKIVTYHGATTEVSKWIGKCRYFVYPSYYPEGVPRCILQALSIGRPVITCTTPGCKETVIEGYNGFLVSPRNSEKLAEKMRWLIEHPAETEMMAYNSRKLAVEKFDVKKINEVLAKKLLQD
jgi:glycosyltransferase involved in cell wall biosynthesis